jgi:hypothetical protein
MQDRGGAEVSIIDARHWLRAREKHAIEQAPCAQPQFQPTVRHFSRAPGLLLGGRHFDQVANEMGKAAGRRFSLVIGPVYG